MDISRFPANARIGDYVYIVDEKGELYLQARILKLEESEAEDTHTATLGDYLIKSGGISQTVRDLATQFQEIASKRAFYTWIAYADDDQGTNLSSDPEGKEYLGVAANRTVETYDEETVDPSIFSWAKIKGEDGSGNAITINIGSSGGRMFRNTPISTTLTAHVYANGVELSASEIARLGSLTWILDGVTVGTGQTLQVSSAQSELNYTVELIAA